MKKVLFHTVLASFTKYFFRILCNSSTILKCLRLFLAIPNYQLFVDFHNLHGTSQTLFLNLLLALVSNINYDFFHFGMNGDCILHLFAKCLDGNKSKNKGQSKKEDFSQVMPLS